MMKGIFIFAGLMILVFVFLINGHNPDNNINSNAVVEFINETLPKKVAELPLLELSTIDNFKGYKSFADNTNNLIKILNEQNDLFDIPYFDTSQESFEKTSKFIAEYSPLIDNYNEVVLSAKNFTLSESKNGLKTFYSAAGGFAFETAIIAGTLFYATAFESVGIVYRAVGLNKLAFKCGSCVSVILSEAHWFVRTVLVEGTSQIAQDVISTVTNYSFSP